MPDLGSFVNFMDVIDETLNRTKKTKRRKPKTEFKIELPSMLYKGFVSFCHDFTTKNGHSPVNKTLLDTMALVLYMVTSHLRSDLMTNMVVQPKIPRKYWKTHLSAALLHKFLGDGYITAINTLVENGFIGRSQSYIKGDSSRKGKCKAFWLCAPYQNSYATYLQTRLDKKLKNTEVVVRGTMSKYTITSPVVLKRIQKSFEERKRVSMEDPVVAICYDELSHFSIDANVADATLNEMVENGKMAPYNAELERCKIERFNGLLDEDGDLYVKHDKYGRIHTNVTNMKKEIRHAALRCDGDKVAEVDIKSSQAAFIIAVFRRYIDFYRNDLNENRDTFLRFKPIWNAGRKDLVLGRMEDELDRYRNLVAEGKIYEFFQSECSADEDIDRQLTRDEAKKGLLSFLFSPLYFDTKREPIRGAVQRCWREHFPNLYNCMWSLKEHCHAALAYEMQKIESSFVFDQVCPRIIEEVGCHFCTVHDSIIVPEQYADHVRCIMDEELLNQDIPTHTDIEYEYEYEATLPERPDQLFIDEMESRQCQPVDFNAA